MFSELNFTTHLSAQVLQWVESLIHQPILAADALVGSTSAEVYRLVAADQKAYVLRLFTWKSWLESEPDLARHEAFALQAASPALPCAPRLIGFDETGKNTTVPAVLMTMLPGSVELEPTDIDQWTYALAQTLCDIHQIEMPNFSWQYKHWYSRNELIVPSWTKVPACFDRLVQLLKTPPPPMPSVFLHRDYHPTNVLWENGKISGVVDWVNACLGPAMVDVGHCRLNLVSLYGVEAADKFLQAWLNLAGDKHNSLWWDVNALADGWAFYEELSVYSGWADFGKTDVTMSLLASRLDEYVESLAVKM